MSVSRTTGAAVFVLLALGFAPPRALACSICQAGDPMFSQQGASAQEKGKLSLYLEFQSRHMTSGVLPHGDEHQEADPHAGVDADSGDHDSSHDAHDHGPEGEGGGHDAEDAGHASDAASGRGSEKHDLQQLDLYLSFTPIDRLTLTLDVPYRFHSSAHREPGERWSGAHNSGPGDVALWLSSVLWRDREVLPTTWIEGRVLLKGPTGRSDARIDGGRDPHIQLGTGSWDFGVGLAAARRLTRGSFYGSVLYRVNTEGSWDYEYGDVFLANAAFEAPFSHAVGIPGLDWITPGLELNFRSARADYSRGERFEHSGGTIAYATPSLRFRLPRMGERGAASLRLAAQIPLGQGGLHGRQHERTTFMAGLLFAF
jgi:hypothetical protein